MTWLGARRIDLASCGSTSDEALRLARAGAEHGTLITAEVQTAGRGRQERAWVSPPGGLYASVILRLPGPPIAHAALPLAVGVAVAEALAGLGVAAALKWPNDIGVLTAAGGWRKLGGILAEATGGDAPAIVVGLGVNVAAPIDPALVDLATSLAALGIATTPAVVLAALSPALAATIDAFVAGGVAAIAPRWHARMAPLSRLRTTVAGATVEGTPLGLDADGALRLRDATGLVHRVLAGELVVPPG